MPRRASPLPKLSRSESRSWKSVRRRSPGAAARPQRQAPSRAGREVPATRSDSSVIIAMAEAPTAYPVNLIDEYDGTVLVASPDLPELTTVRSGSGRSVGACRGSIRGGESQGHSRFDGRAGAPTPTEGDCAHVATLTIVKVLLYRGSATRVSRVSRSELARRLNWHLPRSIAGSTLNLNHGSRLDQIDAAVAAGGRRLDVGVVAIHSGSPAAATNDGT